MSKIRIGVVRGGPSSEYEVSLNSGANVIKSIQKDLKDHFHIVDILIDRDGKWHADGMPTSVNDIHRKVDVIFNALHGQYGEDGKIQHLLESHNIPFTGSGSLGSAIGMNKVMAKKIFESQGIKTPYYKTIESAKIKSDSTSVAGELFNSFILPAIIKPVSAGSSLGVSVAKDLNELVIALQNASQHSDIVLIEEFIPGIEATCGVVENFRGDSLYALPPIEIRHKSKFFDFDSKYSGSSEEIVPANFNHEIKRELEQLSKNVHRLLGLRHYSRTDFIIHPRRGIYVLEVNTLPGLTEESLLPKALHAVGSSVSEFVAHIVGLVRK